MLDERGIDVENDTVVLRREVNASGRARAWVNGTTVTAGVLAEIGRLLVNLHGQHEAQTLLDTEAQRQILDAFGGATEQAWTLRVAHDALTSVRRDIQTLESRRAEAERRADYLRHVVHEIDGATLVSGEDERLEEEARRLEHAEELRSLAQGMTAMLDGDEDARAAPPRRSCSDRSRPSSASIRRSAACRRRSTPRSTGSRSCRASSWRTTKAWSSTPSVSPKSNGAAT